MVRTAMTLVFAAVWMNVWADEVTEKQALEEAQQFVASHNNRKSTPTVKSAGQVSGLYLFNVSGNGGFVIVSNDDQTMPILGFGESGNIDPDDLPDNMRAWLQSYADQIAWLQSNGKDAKDTNNRSRAPRRTAKTTIGPLVQTNWNQGIPYYNLCPEIDGTKTVTGCVATTVAQIMYYHYAHNGFSAKSTDIPGYTTTTTDKNKASYELTVSGLEATTFDWGKMIANYTPINPETGKRYLAGDAEQQQAVAKLMRYCGTALQMKYGLSVNGGSSAYGEAIPYALKTFFGYDGGIQHCYRKNYSYTDWVNLIYSELVANRPVALGGQSAGGGHSFICDGYENRNDADYFHINWGWAGSSDGYFQLSVLQPWEQGIGGSSTLDGFSFGQDAVIGIQQPVDGNADYCLSLEGLRLAGSSDKSKTSKEYTRTNATDAFTGINLYFLVFNYSYGIKTYDYAVQLVDGNGKVVHSFYEATNKTMEWNENNKDKFDDATLSGLSIPSTADDGTHLNDGTYYIKVMSRPHNETPVAWQECFDGDAYKLEAVISDNKLTINVPIPANVKPASVTFAVSGESYTGAEQKVTAIVTGGAGDYSGDIVLRVNGSAVMGQIAHIPAGQDVQLNFSYIPSLVGENTLTLYGGGTITGSGTVNISTLIIDDNGSDNTALIKKNDGRTGNVKLAGRILYKDGKWNTLCLPFPLPLEGSVLAGAEARTLSTASLINGVLTLNFGDPVSELTAGTPYIIKWADGEDITDPVFTNVTISKDPNDFNSSDGNVHFKGRYSSKTYTAEQKNTLLLSGDNTLYYPQPDISVPTSPQYPSIGACRAYFEIGNVAGVRAFKLNFGDESTEVKEVIEVKEVKDNSWYSLEGVKLSSKPAARGLYINYGRKVVIK